MESELKKLEDLLAGGFIVEAEFNARKADLITGMLWCYYVYHALFYILRLF
jgi:hypothetical protein